MNRIAKLFAAMLLAAPLAACGSASPGEPPLAGARIGGPFALTGTDGKTVRDTDFAGKYRIVYFGYTFCPDVCPTDLQKIGAAMNTLEKTDPKTAEKIVPIFISVDPERDDPAVIKEFVANFHPRMVGLTGSPEAIAQVAKEYAVYFKKLKPANDSGNYLVDHSATAYLMDPDGKPMALISHDMTPDEIVATLEKWVS